MAKINTKARALFLDRDDTIITNIPYMSKVEDINYLPNVFEKLKEIQDLGYKIFIVTNQSGLSRELITYKELEEIHQKITDDFSLKGLRIYKYYISPYIHKHPRRKPGPELLLEAERDFNIDLKNSIMIGDGDRDVDAGYNAGLITCFKVKDPSFWTNLDLELF
ncbi:MAG: D-glycero-alpha-D-manno-heptose-1,7-bisphosphate 7-phosphatase [Bdellovibrionales bacterium]